MKKRTTKKLMTHDISYYQLMLKQLIETMHDEENDLEIKESLYGYVDHLVEEHEIGNLEADILFAYTDELMHKEC